MAERQETPRRIDLTVRGFVWGGGDGVPLALQSEFAELAIQQGKGASVLYIPRLGGLSDSGKLGEIRQLNYTPSLLVPPSLDRGPLQETTHRRILRDPDWSERAMIAGLNKSGEVPMALVGLPSENEILRSYQQGRQISQIARNDKLFIDNSYQAVVASTRGAILREVDYHIAEMDHMENAIYSAIENLLTDPTRADDAPVRVLINLPDKYVSVLERVFSRLGQDASIVLNPEIERQDRKMGIYEAAVVDASTNPNARHNLETDDALIARVLLASIIEAHFPPRNGEFNKEYYSAIETLVDNISITDMQQEAEWQVGPVELVRGLISAKLKVMQQWARSGNPEVVDQILTMFSQDRPEHPVSGRRATSDLIQEEILKQKTVYNNLVRAYKFLETDLTLSEVFQEIQ